MFGRVEPLDALLKRADKGGAEKGTPDVANAADDHGHERLDDVIGAHLGGDFGVKADGDTGDPGDAGTEAEGEHVDAARVDAHRGGHAGVLGDGPHFEAEAGAVHDEKEKGEENKRQHEDGNADIADLDNIVEHERSIEPCRRGQRARLRAEDILGQLLEGDGNAEGCKQRLKGAVVEPCRITRRSMATPAAKVTAKASGRATRIETV